MGVNRKRPALPPVKLLNKPSSSAFLRRMLSGDLAQVQHMALHHMARGGASAFHNALVAVFFAVLETGLCA